MLHPNLETQRINTNTHTNENTNTDTNRNTWCILQNGLDTGTGIKYITLYALNDASKSRNTKKRYIQIHIHK